MANFDKEFLGGLQSVQFDDQDTNLSRNMSQCGDATASDLKQFKAKPFTNTEKELLARVIKQLDPNRLLSSASRSADLRNKKDKLWSEVVFHFNNGLSRPEKVTKIQVINLSKNIKRNQRESHDRLHMSATQAKFNKSCAKTGGGSPPKEPPNILLDESFDSKPLGPPDDGLTNNLGPVRPSIIPAIGNVHNSMKKLLKNRSQQNIEAGCEEEDAIISEQGDQLATNKDQSNKDKPKMRKNKIEELKMSEITTMQGLIQEQIKTQKLQQVLIRLQIKKELKELQNLGVDATEEQNITEAINRGM